MIYILTRTSKRPRMFQRLRDSIATQDYAGPVMHIVHTDEPSDDYVKGDMIVSSPHLRKSDKMTAPQELYNLRLLQAVQEYGQPGFVTFMDDDDIYTSSKSLSTIADVARPGLMPIWKVERENGRISPAQWRGDLTSDEGRICWEASGFHTSHLELALNLSIDGNDGADGRFWARMSRHLTTLWIDEILTKPQVGKGHGRRKDE